METVSEKLNQIENLKLLAAQRQLYSKAKQIDLSRFLLAAVIVPLLAVFAPKSTITGITSTFVVIINSAVLAPIMSTTRKKAALVQNLFDHVVLGIPWNSVKLGSKPCDELIARHSRAYTKKEPDFVSLRNWYHIDPPETELTVLACQKMNVWWDSYLRKSYFVFWSVTDIVVVSLLLIFCCLKNFSLRDFMIGVSLPSIPLLLLSLRFYWQHIETHEEQKRIYEYLREIKQKVNNEEYGLDDIEVEAIFVQNEIYSYRTSKVLIPDWFYRLFRKHQENTIRYCK
jgi:hypothetical protein